MSPENKQRVVGFVVLVAFVALLIPFLFTSGVKKKPSTTDEIPINAERRQEIAQQIQGVSDNTQSLLTDQQPPLTAQPAIVPHEQSDMMPPLPSEENQNGQIGQIGAAPVVQPAPTKAAIDTKSTAPSKEMVAPVVVPGATTNNISSAEFTVPDASATQIKPEDSVNKEAKNLVKAKLIKGKNSKIKASTKGFWSVQVGSFSNQSRAQSLVTKLQASGFHVYTQKIVTPKKELTRVLVGHETSKESAAKIAKRLETLMKVKGHIIRSKK